MTKLQTGVSYSKYMSLYTAAYNCYTSSRVHSTTTDSVGQGSRRSDSSAAGANLMGSDLYNNLIRYLSPISSSSRINPIASKMKLSYGTTPVNGTDTLQRERDEGRKGVYPVYTLALVQWKSNFFLHVQSKHTKLAGAILRLIEHQRKWRDDRSREHLETPFLDATEKYYEQESEAFLAESSMRLKEEEDSVDRYLNADTRKQLVSKCEHVLIRQHSDWESFQSLLDFDKDEDLQRMYALFIAHTRRPGAFEKEFEEHVKKSCLAAVAKLLGEGSEGADSLDPKAYVDALLEMVLFKYIEDKDVFQTFYATKLSKRLIHGVSASDEFEASMISKLKEACGFEYTNKLQRMFTDMSLSKDLTDQFQERMQNHEDMDINFSIMVLGTNFWPLSAPNNDFIIPPEILATYGRFSKYYQTKHSGRKNQLPTPNHAHYSSYAESSIIPTANLMLNYILKPVRHESFYKKYAGKRFMKVSILVREWALERWEEGEQVSLLDELPAIRAKNRAERERLAAAGMDGDEDFKDENS
ncbi:hypothetical protein DEU56DRAFT_762288 [Suillus clintonianus]|uniref:uncharacterized protein n=1 Tax=Suillus clintonianus TaxID=1904413 RepID=UPI001B871EC6|nr:uncharacterized protein DEU56DRAFT_762288 [Suillus clintonianus]KAG2110713.1 hypothetical protein DEU56DRAFT_762288 [Suillus clintonianus]